MLKLAKTSYGLMVIFDFMVFTFWSSSFIIFESSDFGLPTLLLPCCRIDVTQQGCSSIQLFFAESRQAKTQKRDVILHAV